MRVSSAPPQSVIVSFHFSLVNVTVTITVVTVRKLNIKLKY